MDGALCLLSPVWPGYRRVAPLLLDCLDRFWTGHPPHFFVAPEAWDLPGEVIETGGGPYNGTNWTWTLLQGVREVRARGFRTAYLIAEEHIPLAPCHQLHLGQTIPVQAMELGAKYISLMGWDNRRYSFRSPTLGPEKFRWMHLTGRRDPRFHLHPAWWDLQTLEACCELALKDSSANGSAWHFEKICDQADASLLPAGCCYQICAGAMGVRARRSLAPRLATRWIFNKLMALVPLLPARWRLRYYNACGFDNVFCDGPYPMVFSGVLAKGKLNPALDKWRRYIDPEVLREVNMLYPR